MGKSIPFIALLLCPFLSSGQSTEPLKKATLIFVTYDTLSANSVYKAVGQTLLTMGYTINKSDKEFGTIETNVRRTTGGLGSAGTSVIIRASIRAVNRGRTEVRLSGVFALVGDKMPDTDIANRGMRGSPFLNSFEKLQAIATELTKISLSQITYAIQ